jgi:HK97 family phage major capsid protein
MLEHAYSFLDTKSIDEPTRTITGIATTPTPDRQGDVVNPLGARFTNPLPLLFHHARQWPIGLVTLGTPTAAGIPFTASLPVIREAGTLRDRVDEAWQSLKAGLLRGVSIGYRLTGAAPLNKHGGQDLNAIEICELSLVAVPANADATIALVKSLDAPFLAATGPTLPGAPGVPPRTKMTITETITLAQNDRAMKTGRLTEIMEAAGPATLSADAANEYDTLSKAVSDLDAHLVRLTEQSARMAASAKPVSQAPASAPVSDSRVLFAKSQLPQGSAFVRAACAVLQCKGNFGEAAEYARARWQDSTPEVALYLKAAVAAGNTTDATWAGPLVNQTIANDFIALLRPATIIGKINGLRTVPFNTKVPAQSAGGAYGWVGEGKAKPVTKLAFTSETLGIAKAAGIIVLTEELVRLSNPSAEALCRADMVAGIAAFLDQQFIDPAVAAVAGVNPASITNGAPTAASSNDPLMDILALMQHFASFNIPLNGVTLIMSEVNAGALAMHRGVDGSRGFPSMSTSGGSVDGGLSVIASQAAGSNVIGLQPSLILYADDGGVTIDASREASIQMDSAPVTPGDATTVYVSLWQNNLVGLRAERFINWKRAGTNAVKYLTAATYPVRISPTGFAAGDDARKR